LSGVEQEQVWELWGTGKSLRAVARAIGCREQQLRRYVWSTGGVRPAARRRAAWCLSMGEREEISRGLARGDSCRQIAVGVGRSHSTVSREVARNGGRDGYRALSADRDAWERARRPKPAKLAITPALRAVVEDKLKLKWSPQQIAGWLGQTYPECEAMRISHETIYLPSRSAKAHSGEKGPRVRRTPRSSGPGRRTTVEAVRRITSPPANATCESMLGDA
jgi:IS30 family transposase